MSKKFYQTPEGIANWPFLTEPDFKYDKGGVYKVELEIPRCNESDNLFELIQKEIKEAGPDSLKEGKPPINYDKENDSYRIRLAMTRHVINKIKGIDFIQKPQIFDVFNNPWPEDIKIQSGAILKCAFVIAPYCTNIRGVTLRLTHVQVIQLKNSAQLEITSPFEAVLDKEKSLNFQRNGRGSRQLQNKEDSAQNSLTENCDDDPFSDFFND